MSIPFLIGFGYKARRGKDTAAQAIIEARSLAPGEPVTPGKYDIKRIGFADALKEEVAGREFELCLRHGLPYEPDNKHRTLLQWYGTEYRRRQDVWYWVKRLAEKVKTPPVPQIVLITDLRFLNEVYWIKANSGVLVRLEREGYTDLRINAAHSSEVELDSFTGWDYTVTVADGDVEELRKDAVRVFDMIIESLNPPDTDFAVSQPRAAAL